MANDCLVTKLKGSVNNNNISRLGTLQNNLDDSTCSFKCEFNDSSILANNFYTEGTITATSASSGTKYTFRGTGYVFIKNKYNIVKISQIAGDWGNNFLKQLAYSPLQEISFAGSNTTIINLEDLSPFKNTLTTLVLSKTGTGDITTIADFMNIIYLSILDSAYSGSIEDFVAIRKINGQTSCDEIVCNINHTNITFNDVTCASNNATLSWSPSGDNTSITWKGTTTTIHVNSDGTWERVS